jgi:hypothetical protein
VRYLHGEKLEDLGEDTVLAAGRQHGTGRLSGIAVDYPIFIVFQFRGDKVVDLYLEGTRDAALKARRTVGVGVRANVSSNQA